MKRLHYTDCCNVCKRNVVICGGCGRSACDSTGKKCPACESAFRKDCGAEPVEGSGTQSDQQMMNPNQGISA